MAAWRHIRQIWRHATMLWHVLPVCALAVSCNVHEWPAADMKVRVPLHLHFQTAMTQSEYIDNTLQNVHTSSSIIANPRMRYVIRFYECADESRASIHSAFTEFVFERDVDVLYDNDFIIDIAPADYTVMVWADFVESSDNDGYFYDASDFTSITKLKPHVGNTDYVDAFRGWADIDKQSLQRNTTPVIVEMERPLAKYEFVSTDLREFLEQEIKAHAARNAANNSDTADGNATDDRGDMATDPTIGSIDLNAYRVMFYYSGYMPNTFNMFTDRPVDAVIGVAFEGKLDKLSDDEISLGFDYVLVNHMETTITVRVAIQNDAGEHVSLTKPINVPIQRNNHTIAKGRFLMEKATGNINIDVDYDGEYNIIINR